MTTKTFSIENGNLIVQGGEVSLFEDNHIISSTKYGVFWIALPQSILFPTDEDLAESIYPEMWETLTMLTGQPRVDLNFLHRASWLAGRKSVKGEFHLTKENIRSIYNARVNGIIFDDLFGFYYFKSLTYPTSITVNHDGEKYLWESLKCKY